MDSVILASRFPILAVGEQRLKAAGMLGQHWFFLPIEAGFRPYRYPQFPSALPDSHAYDQRPVRSFGCPVEACQIPMLQFLAAREQDKKSVQWDGGHFPTDTHIVCKEALDGSTVILVR